MGAPVGLLDDIPKLSISQGELRFALESHFRKDHAPEKGLYWARLEDGKLKGTFEIEGDPSILFGVDRRSRAGSAGSR